jgi:lipopolysaccharide assembly outer membrane protein LptD (OstA)
MRIKVEIQALDKKTGGTSFLKADSTIVDEARNMIMAHGNVKLIQLKEASTPIV